MKYSQYRRLRQRTNERMMRARDVGSDAALSKDWQKMVAACRENDAAYLADCHAQDMFRLVDDLPKVQA